MAEKTGTREVPGAIQAIAVKRCRGFAEHALANSHIGLNFFEVLIVSCYTQGIDDTTRIMRRRTEGRYEEER